MAGIPIPINFKSWIDDHRGVLKPPVNNKMVWPDTEFIVMVVGGPNQRKDYHFNEGEEFFYQIEGDITLRIQENGKPRDIPIRQGEIFLLPPRVPHSPQRGANTVGMVIERRRKEHEKDGLLWFCDKCNEKLYEETFHLTNIETQFGAVFKRFFDNEAHRTCKKCKTVMPKPA